MKLKTKKIIGLCSVLVIAIVGVTCFSVINKKEDRLSKSEVAKLRDKYPVCSFAESASELASIRISSIDEVKEECKTFIYGEVVGDEITYEKETSTGYKDVDEARESMGFSNIDEFYDTTISVIEDTEGIYQAGDQVVISNNAMFRDCTPQLTEGMKFIIPIVEKKYKGKTSTYFYIDGMYYVTDDGYAISCSEDTNNESRMPSKERRKIRYSKSFNGVKVDDLMNDLKK